MDVRRVSTTHIQHLLAEAANLARLVDGREFDEPAGGVDPEEAGVVLRSLERAVNLAAHAAQELEDERLRLRDGWSM